jgi:hypothetical protein
MTVLRILRRPAFYVLPAGLGLLAAAAIAHITMQHDPQREFSSNLWYWAGYAAKAGLLVCLAVGLLQAVFLGVWTILTRLLHRR